MEELKVSVEYNGQIYGSTVKVTDAANMLCNGNTLARMAEKSFYKCMHEAGVEKDLYDGKFFYEVVKKFEHGSIELCGPYNNIYYCAPANKTYDAGYRFVQVIDGKVAQVFTEDQILVTDKLI